MVDKVRRCISPLNTQYLKKSAKLVMEYIKTWFSHIKITYKKLNARLLESKPSHQLSHTVSSSYIEILVRLLQYIYFVSISVGGSR